MDQDHPVIETIVLGCRVHPAPGSPPAEAVLVSDGRIAAVGSESEVRALARAGARIEDLGETATVTAGFVDAHIHFTTWALGLEAVDLGPASSIAEAVAIVADSGIQRGGVIRGHGWSLNRFERKPSRHDLDGAFPHIPVFLDSQDLHSAWVNGAALSRCGIENGTSDPPGGRIERDPRSGEPTGLLLEAARALAVSRLPPRSTAEVASALERAQGQLHALGITGIHSVEAGGLDDVRELQRRGSLRLRVLQHVYIDELDSAIEQGLRSGMGDAWVRIGGVKMFLDGSLGSRTAWLRDPYLETGGVGFPVLSEKDFRHAVGRAAGQGLSSTVHAIGDAAVELAVSVLSSVDAPGLPHRIEHLQLCPPDLWERAARSGIVGSMQPVHILTDIDPIERFWGHERARGAYALAPLTRAGMPLAFGSDAPVETPDPRPGLYAAMARGTWADYRSERRPIREWFPEHALTPAEAIAGYTTGPAFAAGWANRRGRILPGFDADLVAWSEDAVVADPAGFRRLRCTLTMVGGEVVFRAG